MPKTDNRVQEISEGATDTGAYDFGPWLDPGEKLTGTPTVAEVTTTDLTIDTVTVSKSQLTILGELATAGEAVQWRVSGQQADTQYRLRVTTTTDASPARTEVLDVLMDCI